MDSGGTAPAAQPRPGAGPERPQPGVLVLCTANQCRSVMGAPLLARRLARLGVTVPVGSAGMRGDGAPPDPAAVTVMAGYGIEIAAHRSRRARPGDLAQAGLVLAMARENLRDVVVTDPAAWPRAFTLLELIRRAERIGPRAPGEPFGAWLARAHDRRDRTSLLGGSARDDIPDPTGGPRRDYAKTATLLDGLMARLAELGWAHATPPP
jgi:protein-tyrosine phosphatase